MRDQELEGIQKRAFRPKTTQSRHDQPIAPNRLKALPEPPQKPNEVWCADITYIPSQQEGWLYLAGELDLCSRRLVGWKLDTSMAAPLVLDAFERAVKNANRKYNALSKRAAKSFAPECHLRGGARHRVFVGDRTSRSGSRPAPNITRPHYIGHLDRSSSW